MPDPREIELKLDVDPRDVEDLKTRVLPNLGGGGSVHRLLSVYYDTPDHRLRATGMSLRLRKDGERWVQTLKRAKGGRAGLFDRNEWEHAVEEGTLDLGKLADAPLAATLEGGEGRLAPVFESRVTRTTWTVRAGGAEVELALDEGEVATPTRADRFAELELELAAGPRSGLFDLLRELNEVASLRLGVLTKSERGYRLLAKHARPAKAGKVDLEAGMSTAAAFQAIMGSCLRQFRLNETLVSEARDVEGLHQARVALRRLRSALSLFKPVTADGALDRLKVELRDVSRLLGDARNLDVYREMLAGMPEEEGEGLRLYRDDLAARREAAYDDVAQTLDAPAFRRLMLALLGWIENGPWLNDDDPMRRAAREEPIERFAARTLEARHGNVMRKGRKLARLTPPARHRVRIEAKKLRYATEFFAALAGGSGARKRHGAFADTLADLQEHLGALNDIETGHQLAESLANAPTRHFPHPAEAFTAGHLAGENDARVDPLLRKAAKAHAGLCEAAPFWTKWA